MTDQATLFDLEPVQRPFLHHEPPDVVSVDMGTFGSIQEQFEAFHEANPHVYAALVRLARGLVARGRSHVGIGQLFEVLRWSYSMTTVDPSADLKLNNNYRSRYARLIESSEPDLDGLFEKRRLRSE